MTLSRQVKRSATSLHGRDRSGLVGLREKAWELRRVNCEVRMSVSILAEEGRNGDGGRKIEDRGLRYD